MLEITVVIVYCHISFGYSHKNFNFGVQISLFFSKGKVSFSLIVMKWVTTGRVTKKFDCSKLYFGSSSFKEFFKLSEF